MLKEITLFSFFSALLLTLLFRFLAIKLKILDLPDEKLKNHLKPVPYLGGAAIVITVIIAMIILRIYTNFPTGTLHSLRGILAGYLTMFIIGVFDDIKKGGLKYYEKFLLQILGAYVLTLFDIRIKFVQPEWFADLLTILWVVGITNAFNLIDVMDGISPIVCIISSISIYLIDPYHPYIKYLIFSFAISHMVFLYFNLSHKFKIFLGDAGSLSNGFLFAALTLTINYTHENPLGVISAALVIFYPIFETLFLIYVRIKKGILPFLGSKDHIPHKLLEKGWNNKKILLFVTSISTIYSLGG
ncbi:MAG: undecaprenyl/decaprenyl-phosphate alpha-N-acetylglucosaminyl 1-phosphate transferase, partial [bacterium]|nr:undecaprenyl/decaprenyl-phosphate alpha-N-acetylglucosaminyl 1-phosphate transferase [bacterium]